MVLLQAALGSFTAGLGNTDADMQNLTENLVDAFQAVVKNVVPIIENLTNALPDAFSAILPVIGELLPQLLDIVANLFQQVLDTTLKLIPELIPVAVEAIMTIVNTLIDNLPLLIESAFTLIMSLSGGIIDALPQLIPAVIAMIVLLTTELIRNIPEIIKFVPQLFDALVEAFSEVDWMSLGKDLVRGIWDGISSLGDWVLGKIKEFAGGISNAFKDFFGIASPSKLMAEYGKNIDEGLAQGVTENKSIPLNAITAVGQEMASAARTAAKTVMDLLTIDASGISIDGPGGRVAISGGNSKSQSQREKDLAKFKDEIYAVANANKVDISTGYDMWKSNEIDKIYGRDETYSSKQ